jgi:cytochrome c-type biogenesis protein
MEPVLNLAFNQEPVTLFAAFSAGLASFFSPCILPVIPGYFTFLAGASLDTLVSQDGTAARRRLFFSTVAFVLGFSSVFILMGASASWLGGFFLNHQTVLRVAGGALIVLFGLHFLGIFRIRALDMEMRYHFREKPMHIAGTFLVGMAFGAGWSPCVGPLLGSVLAIAANKETVGEGMVLLAVYSGGLAIPFLGLAAFAGGLLPVLKRAKKVMPYINKAMGALLVLVGVALMLDLLNYLARV